MLVHFYIEVEDRADSIKLEHHLHARGYGFVDVSQWECSPEERSEQTLEEIEAKLQKVFNQL